MFLWLNIWTLDQIPLNFIHVDPRYWPDGPTTATVITTCTFKFTLRTSVKGNSMRAETEGDGVSPKRFYACPHPLKIAGSFG